MICMSFFACSKLYVTIPETCPRSSDPAQSKAILYSKNNTRCLRTKARLSHATGSENISMTSVVASMPCVVTTISTSLVHSKTVLVESQQKKRMIRWNIGFVSEAGLDNSGPFVVISDLARCS